MTKYIDYELLIEKRNRLRAGRAAEAAATVRAIMTPISELTIHGECDDVHSEPAAIETVSEEHPSGSS